MCNLIVFLILFSFLFFSFILWEKNKTKYKKRFKHIIIKWGWWQLADVWLHFIPMDRDFGERKIRNLMYLNRRDVRLVQMRLECNPLRPVKEAKPTLFFFFFFLLLLLLNSQRHRDGDRLDVYMHTYRLAKGPAVHWLPAVSKGTRPKRRKKKRKNNETT